MKKLSLVLILAVSTIISSLAQQSIVKQFKDELYAETTVLVVKDKDTNDLDILNDNFDLDEIGMGEVIRIDSGSFLPVKDTPNDSEQAVEPEKVVQAKKVIKESVQLEDEVASQPVEEVAPVKVVKKSSSKSRKSSSVSKKKRKSKKRWFKPKKRKRVKRKRYSSCYSF